ncbi:MAG TPA: carboxypeptidase-like regulatory domain-containing protein, partial [Longimicrobiaceae bacterium]|nr:carboxypeptidase-like regulatory domain-containing protein [Longimicrobiaceae bacterium]
MRRCLSASGLFLGALLLALGFTGTAYAQSATTAAITGTVTNQQGQPLSGVQVVVTNASTGGRHGTLTRGDGRYLLPGLPPGGPYQVEARALGYETRSFVDVSLAISQTQRFDFQLTEQAVAVEGLTVTAERGAVISKDRMGTSTIVQDSAISRLPTITRDFTDFVRLSPQISTGGSGAQAGGRNNRYNSIQIDGSVNNDLFGLAASGTPGGQAGTKPISLEAIQEFQVVISPMDVR